MVSSPHEALIRITQEDPEVITRTFKALGVEFPETRSVTIVSADANEVRPIERRIDAVIQFKKPDGGEFLVLIEVQRAKDPSKPPTWLFYQAYEQIRHQIPAMLVVICTKRSVAEWAAQLCEFGEPRRTAMLEPVVLSAANVPKILSVDDAEKDIPLATLSLIVHAGDAEHGQIMETLATAMRERTPNVDLDLWYDLVEQGLGGSLAKKWSEMMGSSLAFMKGPTSQLLRAESRAEGREEGLAEGREEGRAEGREEGREEGMAEGRAQQCAWSIIRILRSREVGMSRADRERILDCTDVDVLEAWLDRALLVSTADDIWDAGHVVAQRSGVEAERP